MPGRKLAKMFTVVYLNSVDERREIHIVGRDNLFSVLWILDHSDKVKRFKVCEPECTIIANDSQFCWGPFSKWVDRLFDPVF